MASDGRLLIMSKRHNENWTLKNSTESNLVERINFLLSFLLPRHQLTNNLNFHSWKIFPMRKIFIFSDAAVDDFAIVVIVCVSYHPTSTNETFSCYRFAFISLSLAFAPPSWWNSFFLFICPQRTQQSSKVVKCQWRGIFFYTRLQLPSCSFSFFFLSQMPKFELLERIFRINIKRHTCEMVMNRMEDADCRVAMW